MENNEENIIIDKLSGRSFRKYNYFEHSVLQDVETGYINAGSFVRDIMRARGTGQRLKDFRRTMDFKYIIDFYKRGNYPVDIRWGGFVPHPANDENEQLTDEAVLKHIFIVYDVGYGNDFKGTYVPYRVFQLIALWADIDHKFAILELLEAINEKALAMHHSAYEEMKNEIERLTRERDEAIRRDEESNRGFDHHRAGTILLQLLPEHSRRGVRHPPNCYTFKIRETEVDPAVHTNEIIISNIFNIDRMKTLIYFYAKNCDLEFVSVDGTKLLISNMEAFKTFVSSLQSFAFDPPYNIDLIIEKYTSSHRVYSKKYIGDMFELYCSKVFNLRWYKLDRTEKLALLKYDRGIDLISIDNRVIAQCKYYKTSLDMSRLVSFHDCCQAFEGWSHILIVNSSAELSTEIKESKEWTIRRIPDKEFEDFLSPFIAELEERPKPEIKPVNLEKLRFKYSTDMMKQIHDFISSKLDETSILVSEAIELVNSSFELNKPINERKLFTICHDLYKRSNQGTLPIDENGNRMLIRAYSNEEQEEFIVSTIAYGEYIRDEFIPIFNKRFKEALNSKGFTKRFSRLFITNGRSNTPPTRYFNSKEIAILELRPRYVPNRNQEFSDFIDSISTLSKDELIEGFNSQFHRFENVRSWNKLLNDIESFKNDDLLSSFIEVFTIKEIERHSKNDVYNVYCELVANPLSRSAFNDEMNGRFRDARLLIDGHRVHVWKRLLNEAK